MKKFTAIVSAFALLALPNVALAQAKMKDDKGAMMKDDKMAKDDKMMKDDKMKKDSMMKDDKMKK